MRTYFSIKDRRFSAADDRLDDALEFRQNPSFIATDGALDGASTEVKWEIAQGIADLERKVWGKIAPHFIEGPHSFMGSLMSGDDVLLGVSFADEDDAIGGPYLSYFIAEEEDLDSTLWGITYERITGESFDDFIERIPSTNPRLFYRKDQSREDSPLAKREHRELMDDLYDYMESEGIAFVTYARADTTYKLMKAGKQGNMVIAAESLIPDFYGPGDDCYIVMGYYVPPGYYEPEMIHSTR